MASYAVTGNANPTIRRIGQNGQQWQASWNIVETTVAANNEFTIDISQLRAMAGDTASFEVTYYDAYLRVLGAAATVRPKLGRVTGWTTDTPDDIGTIGAAAAVHLRSTTSIRFKLDQGSNIIYVSSTPNNTAGEIDTEIIIQAGHQ